jgi:hypothetical protein
MTNGFAENWAIVRIFGKQSYLLISLVTLLVLLPLLTADDASPIWSTTILTIIMIAGPLSIAQSRSMTLLALVLGLAMTSSNWIEIYSPVSWIRQVGNVATVSFFLLLSILLFDKYLLGKKEVNPDTLLAAINAYICIGIMYAFAYFFLLQADPGAFSGTFMNSSGFEGKVYLSFVTMTTLGYGDITPQTEFAAVLTWTQALLGQLFIALTIARIIGMMVAKETS